MARDIDDRSPGSASQGVPVMSAPAHNPVLCSTSVSLLQPAKGMVILDGTFGRGGHARRLLDAGAEVLGLDLDHDAVAVCEEMSRARPGLSCRALSFRKLDEALTAVDRSTVDGILLDLGVSSPQIDRPDKGFTYRESGPLDLRFDQQSGETAAELLARLEHEELADLLWKYGEERRSRRIARAIVKAGQDEPVVTTKQLYDVVARVSGRGPRLNATLSRVFQALRIVVNDELGALEEALARVPDCLSPGGRCVVISYHSLEDRIVKRWLAKANRECICPPEIPVCSCNHERTMKILTRRAIRPDEAETAENPRARSARLRAGEKVQ